MTTVLDSSSTEYYVKGIEDPLITLVDAALKLTGDGFRGYSMSVHHSVDGSYRMWLFSNKKDYVHFVSVEPRTKKVVEKTWPYGENSVEMEKSVKDSIPLSAVNDSPKIDDFHGGEFQPVGDEHFYSENES